MALRTRLTTINPARTILLRGTVRPGILVEEAEAPMSQYEIGGYPVTSQIAGSLGMIHPDGEILVHFKVKMGWVHAVIGPYHADLLPAPDLLPLTYDDLVEMAIE